MSTTTITFTSYRPGSGPVAVTLDDDEAAARLSDADGMTRAGGAAPADRRPVPGRDPFDPQVGKWAAVVLREDAADAREALEPLLHLRRADGVAFNAGTGTPGLVVIDRPTGDQPWKWEEALRDVTGVPPHHMLLVGGPDRFPFEVVSAWNARRIVGMLDVADEPLGKLSWDAVHRYARKVYDHGARQTDEAARADAGESRPSQRRGLVFAFATDDATKISYAHLARPLQLYLREQVSRVAEVLPPLALMEGAATARGLLEMLRVERPALVFTCTHGIEHPSDPRHWGALTAADYPTGGPLAVDSIAVSAPFVEGGVVFAFACFSAGIPRTSALMEVIAPSYQEPEQVPRIAPLPRVLLGRERGPLAFIGHVDRASTSSFGGFDGPAAFRDLADFLLGGLGTVGQGMSTFREQALQAADQLATVFKPDSGATAHEQIAAWVMRHDTAGWLLLGDPCVRLFPPSQPPAR